MQKEIIFLRIREVTVRFATLEHRLQRLLEILMGEDDILMGPLFIHDLNLPALLRKIRIVAYYRIQRNEPLLDDLERTVKRINTIREERNLLIHGDWQVEDIDSFPIKVRDFKMTYEAGAWQEFTETAFTEKKLAHLIRRLKGLAHEVEHLVRKFSDPQIMSSTTNAST